MEISETKIKRRTDTNSYYFDVTINGKRYRRSGFKTKKEAIAGSIKLIDKVTDDDPNKKKEVIFRHYYNDWVKAYNKLKLSEGQSNWYKRAIKVFCKYFGENVKANDVTRTDYQKFLNNYGRGRTSVTVRKVSNCLAPVFADLQYEGYIERDPTYKAKYNGTVSSAKASDKYLSIEDYLTLVEYFRKQNSPSGIALLIMALTGARNSEAINVSVNDIDVENGLLRINGTKTASSKRTIEVNQDDLELILEKMNALPRRTDNKPIQVSSNALNKTFKNALKKCDIEVNRTAYSLRHTHCSFLLSKGLPIEYISHRLGHSNISTTLDIYSHLLEEEKSSHGDTVRNLFA